MVDQQAESPEGTDVAMLSLKVVWRQNFFLLRETLSFLFVPSANWMWATHIMEGNLLSSESTDLKVNHI